MKRGARNRRGFTILEIVVVLGILSALALSAAWMMTPQIHYFRVRAATLRLEAALRDQQAQAARAGYANGGARGGGVMFFRGRATWDRDASRWQVEGEDQPDAYSYLTCTLDYSANPDRPTVRLPSATALSGLTQDELARAVEFPEAVLYQDAAATAPVQPGDYVLFAERDLQPGDSGPGTKPLDRGAAIFSAGLDAGRRICVRGTDNDPRYSIVVDAGGLVFARKD